MTSGGSRTNGFLFADLRDYTRFVEARGDRAAAELLDAYRSLVRSTVAEFGGAEVKTEGDSFYVVFPSASSAVQCGLAILRAAGQSTAQGGGPIRVGIGVHAGETVETSEGYVGSAVNMAARVCAQARPGELLVTDTVRGLLRTVLPVRFTDRRMRRLKGITEPVALYRVDAVGADHPALSARRTSVERVRDVVATSDRLRGVGRWVAIGAVLIVAATGAYLLLGFADRARNEGVGEATPSATTAATGPTSEQEDLLAQVPSSVRDVCAVSEEAADSLGGVAVVRCELPAGEDADLLWYERFGSRQSLENAISALYREHNLPRGECGAEVPRAQGNWQVGSTHSGHLLCYSADGETWVVWTYDVERIVARAVRSGDRPEDWAALYEWWSEIRLFLR
ncbi:MAG: adenylate/guanylate cyclase domain-containing protein [Chloroflexota bacterium]|nr:adenylate/guanylate cyclase domain-containing protein [Chloroflexota bacterium]